MKESRDASSIRRRLERNAADLNLAGARIHVARGHGGHWWVRVVHNQIAPLSEPERRAKFLAGIADLVEHAEILTEEEEQWYGPPFLEGDGALPTWPDALSQDSDAPLLFASDLDEDLPRPAVVTFYSLKGGVGRTTALAAAARLLAQRGHRVLVIDMDFEAPGLPYVLGLPEPGPGLGALPLLLALERGEEVDIRDHTQRVSEAEELYCIGAGQLGLDYAERLQLIEPESWYREELNPLHRLIDLAGASSIEPDFVLLDSRTGISPISAPLLFDIADLAVVCFFPHPQARRGTELLVESLLAASTRRSSDRRTISPEPRFLVSPVPPGPSRIKVADRALAWIEDWLAPAQDRRDSAVGPLHADELSYVVHYSPETAFADRFDLSPISAEVYGPIADWLEQLLPAERREDGAAKQTALDELVFSTGMTEYQESFFEDFVKTKIFDDAMDRRYPLVVGRKGTGKTAVFRWLLDRTTGERPAPVMCPPALGRQYPWLLGEQNFAAIERHLREREHPSGWPAFWSCYTTLATHLSTPMTQRVDPPDELGFVLARLGAPLDDLTVEQLLKEMLDVEGASSLAARWLRAIDSNTASHRLLLFDGLDTGFGNDDAGRSRRTRAVTGLFTYVMERENQLTNLSFKLLLRYDIWQDLEFQNKSHLYGRSVQLRWRNQADYFKTVLKQAVRSNAFVRMLGALEIRPEVERWSEREVYQAWNVLVGERMKGGKTTFTRNWVWNRLADGQGGHSPRALLQLFHRASQWERQEAERNPYERSIIRPRALVPSLELVSTAALEALLEEEFPELRPLVGALQTAGRTPLDSSDIEAVNEDAVQQLELAIEVGLVAVHEGTQEAVRRYRVPDLYRHALGMTRKGQA